jgi:uncharacterized membrane protein YsdA (DUF1294 family)
VDPRNRPAVIGALIGGCVAFGLLWLLGLPLVLAWMAGWSVPAFALYGIDKRQAQTGGWRIPELVLHGLALGGGVIGAWAGRLVFHHKTRHVAFTIVLAVASLLWAAIVIAAIVRA